MSVLTSPLLKPDFHYDHPHHCDRPLLNLFPITGIIMMISGIAFNRPDHLSRLRAFPCDRFKIYTIVLIVRIELISIQVIKVISDVRVVCDHLGSVSICPSQLAERYWRWLGWSGESGLSYGNQALSSQAWIEILNFYPNVKVFAWVLKSWPDWSQGLWMPDIHTYKWTAFNLEFRSFKK